MGVLAEWMYHECGGPTYVVNVEFMYVLNRAINKHHAPFAVVLYPSIPFFMESLDIDPPLSQFTKQKHSGGIKMEFMCTFLSTIVGDAQITKFDFGGHANLAYSSLHNM